MSPQLEIITIAILVAITCSLTGVFLLLRRLSMMSDSITHTILLGIVIAFFIVQDLNSIALIVGATLMGLITVWLTELINKTHLVNQDGAIGIVFPLLFSIAVILITKFASDIHLDIDAVLLGELAFAPFDRVQIFNISLAKSIVTASILLIINLLFVIIYYKHLKITTFDSVLATTLGFSVIGMHYCLMTLTSLNTVGAFEAVGSVLVVSLMIGPAASAYLITNDLKKMLIYSALYGIIACLLGYQVAMYYDVSLAGSIAVMIGLLFILTVLFSFKQGVIVKLYVKQQNKIRFQEDLVLVHILNHQYTISEKNEIGQTTINNHLKLPNKKMDKLLNHLMQNKCIYLENKLYRITQHGKLRIAHLN